MHIPALVVASFAASFAQALFLWPPYPPLKPSETFHDRLSEIPTSNFEYVTATPKCSSWATQPAPDGASFTYTLMSERLPPGMACTNWEIETEDQRVRAFCADTTTANNGRGNLTTKNNGANAVDNTIDSKPDAENVWIAGRTHPYTPKLGLGILTWHADVLKNNLANTDFHLNQLRKVFAGSHAGTLSPNETIPQVYDQLRTFATSLDFPPISEGEWSLASLDYEADDELITGLEKEVVWSIDVVRQHLSGAVNALEPILQGGGPVFEVFEHWRERCEHFYLEKLGFGIAFQMMSVGMTRKLET